jgi:hypothetical protein
VSAPYRDRFAATEHDQELDGSPASNAANQEDAQSSLVAGIQQRQAEYERLLGLCQQLRQQHRCPGRCVFRGELRRSGLSMFRSMLDGRA